MKKFSIILLFICSLAQCQRFNITPVNQSIKFPDAITSGNLEGWFETDHPSNTIVSGTMTKFFDRSANARHLTLTHSTLPIYTTSGGANNKPYIDIDITHDIYSSFAGPYGSAVSIYIVVKQNDLSLNVVNGQGNDRQIFSVGRTGAFLYGFYNSDISAALGSRSGQFISTTTFGLIDAFWTRLQWATIGGVINTTNSSFRINWEPKGSKTVSLPLPIQAAPMNQFAFGNTTLGAKVSICAAIVYSGALSAADDLVVRRYLMTKYNPAQPDFWLGFGDSLTANGTPYNNAYLMQVALFKGIDLVNFAVGGTTIYDAGSGKGVPGSNLVDVYQLPFDGAPYNGQYVSFNYGVNDNGQGIVDATWQTTYQSYIQSYIDHGYDKNKMLIVIPPARSDSQAGRANVNSRIATIAANLGIPIYNAFQSFINSGINDSLFADSLHPNTAGFTRMATDIEAMFP